MTSLRRIVPILLLLTVLFHAAVGATGLICANEAHHSHDSDSTENHHDADTLAHEHHGQEAFGTHGGPAHDNSPGSHDGPGKRSICSACCFSAAAVPASMPDFVRPDATLKVSANVGPILSSRAGDGLFRPPRTITI